MPRPNFTTKHLIQLFRTSRSRYRSLRHIQKRGLQIDTPQNIGKCWATVAYPQEIFRDGSDDRTFLRESREIAIYEDVTVWPDYGLMSSDGLTVEKSVGFSEERTQRFIDHKLLKNFPVIPVEGLVISLSLGLKNHYHYLIDDISRLTLLEAIPRERLANLVLVATEDIPRGYLGICMNLLGPETRLKIVPERSRISCEKYLSIPPLSRGQAALIDPRVAEALQNSLPPISPRAGTRRIYISRQFASKRRVTNEASLTAAIEDFGFKPVILERLSLTEQKILFAESEFVIANHGAGLTNLIFAQGCRGVLEIHYGHEVGHYRWLCSALGIPHTSLVVPASTKNSDAIVPVGEVIKWIASPHL